MFTALLFFLCKYLHKVIHFVVNRLFCSFKAAIRFDLEIWKGTLFLPFFSKIHSNNKPVFCHFFLCLTVFSHSLSNFLPALLCIITFQIFHFDVVLFLSGPFFRQVFFTLFGFFPFSVFFLNLRSWFSHLEIKNTSARFIEDDIIDLSLVIVSSSSISSRSIIFVSNITFNMVTKPFLVKDLLWWILVIKVAISLELLKRIFSRRHSLKWYIIKLTEKDFIIGKSGNFDMGDPQFCYHLWTFSKLVTYVIIFNRTSGIKVYVEKLYSVEIKMTRENAYIILHWERNIKKLQHKKLYLHSLML